MRTIRGPVGRSPEEDRFGARQDPGRGPEEAGRHPKQDFVAKVSMRVARNTTLYCVVQYCVLQLTREGQEQYSTVLYHVANGGGSSGTGHSTVLCPVASEGGAGRTAWAGVPHHHTWQFRSSSRGLIRLRTTQAAS